MILDDIVARRRVDVAALKQARPLDTFAGELAPSPRSFAAALSRPRAGLVLECKAASPSQGVLRPDYDPAAVASGYASVADAISVLAEAHWFGGSLQHVAQVRAAVDLPVLCKDFVVDPWQVFAARAEGADAILLMASVLDDAGLAAGLHACRQAGMEALVEVHDEAELQRVLPLHPPVIGINSRNLRTLDVDLGVIERLAPRCPAGTVVVAESGIRGHADLRRLRSRVDAFLIGTALTRAPHPGVAARAVAYGRVKVCGLTSSADARAAADAGASLGGLIFAPESPRCVPRAQAAAVQKGAPELGWVGVFVNAELGEVVAAADELGLVAVQLHGDESAAYVTSLRPLLPRGCAIWKAVGVAHRVPELAETGADRLVLDASVPGARGGTGQRFDWGLVTALAERGELILAGGLRPDNAAEADALGVWALDVSSGVEAAPGRKSGARLAAFFGALRGGREHA